MSSTAQFHYPMNVYPPQGPSPNICQEFRFLLLAILKGSLIFQVTGAFDVKY